MKIMFISDIHGIKKNIEYIKIRFSETNCDKMVVLGDLYYAGAINDLNIDYDVNYIRKFLETFKERLICMRGNCDSEFDITKSNFPIISEISLIKVDNLNIYLTHGNIYNINNHEKIHENAILVYGHEHIPYIKKIQNKTFINAGSISLPRNNLGPTYMIYNDRTFTIYNLENKIIDKINF
ncbi:MAG: phosphodiesterase [Bacilli bacterium]